MASELRPSLAERNGMSLVRELWARRGLRLGMSMLFSVVLALALFPLMQSETLKLRSVDEPLYTAKGSPLELSLFVKGDSLRRVQGSELRVASHDTLQLLPPGASKPFVAIYGYEPGSGLTRLFPAQGNQSTQISTADPPPGLVLSSGEENRLICIAQEKAFSLRELESALQVALKQANAKGETHSAGQDHGDDDRNSDAMQLVLPAPWHVQAFHVQSGP